MRLGVLKGFRASIAALGLLALAACAGSPEPVAPEDGCVQAGLGSNGWHANLYLPAEAFDPDGPLRRWRPDADWFAIGWGDARAYRRLGPVSGASAILWPTPSLMHAAWFERDPREAYAGREIGLALSRAEARALADAIEQDLALGQDGAVQVEGPGLDRRGSAFLAARPRYHLFRTCNVWLARRLEQAGLEAGWTDGHLLPGSLLRETRRHTAADCGS
ncbi:MAG: DUF2459 domain-containing protein [Pseudomonadota bacterium]